MHRAAFGTFLTGVVLSLPAFAGLDYVERTRTQGKEENSTSKSRVRMEGTRTRIDLVETDNAMFGAGSYMLVEEQAGTMSTVLVKPADRTYMRFDMNEMAGMMEGVGEMGQAQRDSGMETRIEDAKFELLEEKPGGALLGRATTYYRYRTSYKQIDQAALGQKMASQVEIVEEVWIDPAVALGSADSAVRQVSGAGFEHLEALEALEAKKPQGFALRRVTVESSKLLGMGRLAMMGMGGGNYKETTTAEVEQLQVAAIEESVFAIPAGFRETQFSMPGMPGRAGIPDLDDEE